MRDDIEDGVETLERTGSGARRVHHEAVPVAPAMPRERRIFVRVGGNHRVRPAPALRGRATARVPSGVQSRGPNPVPPVVTISPAKPSAMARNAPATLVDAVGDHPMVDDLEPGLGEALVQRSARLVARVPATTPSETVSTFARSAHHASTQPRRPRRGAPSRRRADRGGRRSRCRPRARRPRRRRPPARWSASMPPSTWSATARPRSSSVGARPRRSSGTTSGMNDWPPKPGCTVMSRSRSMRSRNGSRPAKGCLGVDGEADVEAEVAQLRRSARRCRRSRRAPCTRWRPPCERRRSARPGSSSSGGSRGSRSV